MAALIPFRALRPRPSDAAQVAAVPYDVVTTSEAQALADGNPVSFLRVSRAEIELPPSTNPYGGEVYERAQQNFARAEGTVAGPRGGAVGLLLPSPNGAARADRTRRVLLARRVRPRHHQEARTHAARQGRRPHAPHDRARRADRPGVSDLPRVGRRRSRSRRGCAAGAALRFRGGGRRPSHDLAGRRAPDLPRAGRGVRADSGAVHRRRPSSRGQRRTSARARGERRTRARRRRRRQHCSGRRLSPRPGPDPSVQPRSSGTSGRSRRRRSSRRCANASPSPPVRRRLRGAATSRCTSRANGGRSGRAFRPIRRMRSDRSTSACCRTQLLAPILGIADVRTDKRIDFVGGAQGHGGARSARSTPGRPRSPSRSIPVSVADLMAVSDAGAIMPPKSTWFEPKLRDGLLIHVI